MADPARSDLSTDRDTAIAGLDSVVVTVTLRDANGVPLADETVDFAASGSGNTLSAALPTDTSGTTTAQWTSTVAETKTITAFVGGVQIATHTVLFSPGPATALAFAVPPSSAIAGAPISPAIEVDTVDTYGNIVPTSSGYVTLAIAANPGATQLHGTTFASVTAGRATFSNAHVDVPASGYTLQASATTGTLASATSGAFDITPGPPDAAHSSLAASPASLDADGVSAAQLTVHVANPYGIALANVPVTLAVTGSNNTLTPMSGMTSTTGTFVASLSSTTPEFKTVTASVASVVTLTTQVHFYPLGCTPQLPGAPWTPLPYSAARMITADIDGDGHVDAVLAESDHQVEIYRGHADGTFTSLSAFPLAYVPLSMVAGDFNNDGHLDLAVTLEGSNALEIALGTGGGAFGAPTTLALPSEAYKVITGDFNRDGKLDLVVMLPNGHEALVEVGAGNGTFTAGSALTNVDMLDLVSVDLDGDGKLDLVSSGPAELRTWFGDGAGGFAASVRTYAPDASGKLFLGDFDNDGRADVTTGGFGQTPSWHGNSDGTFTAVTAPAPVAAIGGGPDAVAVVDLDGDNRLDLVTEASGAVSVLKGAGDGTFAFVRVYYGGANMALVDTDGDGIRDIVSAANILGVRRGQPGGRFLAPALYPYANSADHTFASAGDLDGNGRIDVIREKGGVGLVGELTNLDGSLTDAATVGQGQQAYDLVVEDVTGDGAPDLVALYSALMGITLETGVGNGNGTFQALTSQSITTPYLTSLQPANLDGDARQDLVMLSMNTAGFWLARAQANGTFGPLVAISSGTKYAVAKDVSGDGITDVLTWDMYGDLAVYKGDGAGSVLSPVSYPLAGLSGPIVVGDVDNDGVVDVVMMHEDTTTHLMSMVVLRGLGGGTFGAPIVTPGLTFPTSIQMQDVRLADITGDGVLDLEVSTNLGFAVLGGYGDGYFRQHPQYYGLAGYTGISQSPSVVISDRDGDGRQDLTFGAGTGIATALNTGCLP